MVICIGCNTYYVKYNIALNIYSLKIIQFVNDTKILYLKVYIYHVELCLYLNNDCKLPSSEN